MRDGHLREVVTRRELAVLADSLRTQCLGMIIILFTQEGTGGH